MLLVGQRIAEGEGCLPCRGIAKCNSERDPVDVNPTPKHGWSVYFTFTWSLDKYVDQGNYERPSVTLVREVSKSALYGLAKGLILRS